MGNKVKKQTKQALPQPPEAEHRMLVLQADGDHGFLFFFLLSTIFFFFFHTQHNIQNKTKQNSRHILNISRFNQKGGREGRTTRTQKLLL